jgi:hypothetical protein
MYRFAHFTEITQRFQLGTETATWAETKMDRDRSQVLFSKVYIDNGRCRVMK